VLRNWSANSSSCSTRTLFHTSSSAGVRELGIRKSARGLGGAGFIGCRVEAGVGRDVSLWGERGGVLVRKGTDLSMSGSRSNQRHPAGLLGANVEEGGYPGIVPTSRPRVLLVVVSLDEDRPGVGAGVDRGGESASVSVMSVLLRRSSGGDSEGLTCCSCCNALRRCSRRAVDDWEGGT
jgi:hypothetical protein